MDIIPSDLATYGGEAKNLLRDLQSRNERMFLLTLLVLNLADTKQKLDNEVFGAAAIALPNSSNTIETVVDVGSPRELNASSKTMSAIITAKKIIITSAKLNICGWKMPDRAISIMPEEKVAPSSTPNVATHIVVLKLAMRDPMAEFKKLTASLLTPTNKSKQASKAKKTSTAI